jgi:hypothetical protein
MSTLTGGAKIRINWIDPSLLLSLPLLMLPFLSTQYSALPSMFPYPLNPEPYSLSFTSPAV